MDRKYKIWSIEHGAWWNPDHRGYTPNVDLAGIYNYKEAKEIVDGANRCGQFHECMIPLFNLIPTPIDQDKVMAKFRERFPETDKNLKEDYALYTSNQFEAFILSALNGEIK